MIIKLNGDFQARQFAEPGDLHVDVALTRISVDYANDQAQYVANAVLPRIPVEKKSDKYFVHDMEAFGSDNPSSKAPGGRRVAKGPYAKIDWAPTTASFSTVEYGYEYDMDEEELRNADPGANPELATTRRLSGWLLNSRERRAATLLTNTAVMTNNATLTGGDRWDDYTNSDPIGQVDTRRQTIEKAGSPPPNTILMGPEVWDKVKRHPKLLEYFKYTEGGALSKAQLAEVFEVQNVLIPRCKYRSTNRGQTTTLGYTWGKNVVLAYITPTPNLFEPSLGYQLVYTDQVSERYSTKAIRVETHRVREEVDEKIVAAACGFLLKTVVS